MVRILFITMSGWSYPSSRLRVFNYLPYLDGKYEYEVLPYGSEWVFRTGVKLANQSRSSLFEKGVHRARNTILRRIDGTHNLLCYLNILKKREHYDLVFVQKAPLPRWIVSRIKERRGARLIFDFDDAVFLRQGRTTDQMIDRYNHLMTMADAVITTSQFNRKYVEQFNQNVHLLLTPVDTERYRPRCQPKQTDKVVIGWVGTPSTTRHLKAFLPVLEEIDRRHDVAYRFIGAVPFENGLKDVRFLPWEYNTEVQYMQEFDIGIMPLIQEDYVLGKAGYKLLQYMAIGIPSVASPWGVNSQIVKHGVTSFLAASEEDWLEYLMKLVEDEHKRGAFGVAARKVAIERHSVKAQASVLLRILAENSNHSVDDRVTKAFSMP